MHDKIETVGHSLIQHGKHNDRIYLLKLDRRDYPRIVPALDRLAARHCYSKIFVKAPLWAKQGFQAGGYLTEARVPRFYRGAEDALFLSKFLSPGRARTPHGEQISKIISYAKQVGPAETVGRPDGSFQFCRLTAEDTREMAAVYRAVFETYPFPIHDPAYLAETMAQNIVYFGIRKNGALVALSSCEMDRQSQNVEMTDFAILPEHRSQGLATFLLARMEQEMKKRDVLTAYTIARATSWGMNITFGRHRYTYTGTLVNNTAISGSIESMNVWYKPLDHALN